MNIPAVLKAIGAWIAGFLTVITLSAGVATLANVDGERITQGLLQLYTAATLGTVAVTWLLRKRRPRVGGGHRLR